MNNVKKDDKQRIIAQQKGMKSNIVNRQTKQIIRQSKVKLSKAETDEENEQKGDNYAVNRLEQQGKKSGKYVAKKSKFLLKGQFRSLVQRKRRTKLSEKDIAQKLNEYVLNNAVNIAKNKQKIKKNTAVLFKDGSVFHKRKINVKVKLLAEKVKFKAQNINQMSKAEQQKEVTQKTLSVKNARKC